MQAVPCKELDYNNAQVLLKIRQQTLFLPLTNPVLLNQYNNRLLNLMKMIQFLTKTSVNDFRQFLITVLRSVYYNYKITSKITSRHSTYAKLHRVETSYPTLLRLKRFIQNISLDKSRITWEPYISFVFISVSRHYFLYDAKILSWSSTIYILVFTSAKFEKNTYEVQCHCMPKTVSLISTKFSIIQFQPLTDM